MKFTIRQSVRSDAPHFPAIEHSAAGLFRTIPELAWVADGNDMSVERHREFIDAGTSWMVETIDAQLRAAFLCSEVFGRTLHIWELAVASTYQRCGMGRALMERAVDYARQQALASITLTTFRSVAWNEPAYARMGFVTLQP